MENIRQKTVSNFIWKLMERILAQLVSTVVSIVLARILMPDDYGVVAVVLILINICNVFVSQGFASALIQKKDADELDFSSMFYASLAVSFLIYALICIASPYISAFFGEGYELLTPILRVMGLQIPVSAVKSIQQAYISRRLEFRKFFWATLGGTLISAAVGIIMALKGFGAWALVGQYLTNTVIDTSILTLTVKWRPRRMFSLARIRVLFSFGSKMLFAGLVDEIYTNLRSFVIGKQYSAADLAFYNKGHQFPSLFITNVNSSLMAVLFPVMSRFQSDRERLVEVCRKAIKVSTFVIFPIMAGLAAISENFIAVLLSEKWLPSVPYVRIFCAVFAFYPIYTANLQGIKAIGRSGAYLATELSKKVVGITFLIISIPYGVMGIALSLLFSTMVNYVINGVSAKIVLGYSFVRQVTDILPNLFITAVMAGAVYLLGIPDLAALPALLVQVAGGAAVYALLAFVTKNESMNYILSMWKERKKAQSHE